MKDKPKQLRKTQTDAEAVLERIHNLTASDSPHPVPLPEGRGDAVNNLESR